MCPDSAPDAPEAKVPSLTDRERQVLELASGGLTAPMIGRELMISTLTVKAHFENIRAKLGVHDRTAAVAYALRHGLIS